MTKRVIFGILFAAISFAAIWFGEIYLFGAIFICAWIACYEYAKAFKAKGYNPIMPVLLSGVSLIIIALFKTKEGVTEVTILRAFALATVAIVMLDMAILVLFHKKHTVPDAAISIMGAFYISGLMSFFVLLRGVEGAGGQPYGRYYVILAALVTAMADTFALFAGKLFGKRKLIPDVSPNKTIAGSIGAIAGAMLFSFGYGILMNACKIMPTLLWYDYIIIGFIIGIISQIGDLCASSIKRYCGIKDFGKLIPGHGGILDRLDSHMYILPFVYFYVLFFAK